MKTARVLGAVLLLAVTVLAVFPGAALAQEPEDEISINALFPVIEGTAGGTFEFEIEMMYVSAEREPGEFQIKTIAPTGWDVYLTPKYEKENKVSAISLDPGMTYADSLKVFVKAPIFPLPDPGDYPVSIELASGDVIDTVELTARITAVYLLFAVSATERYDMAAQAGEDNFYSIKVQNFGTAPIDDIKFEPDKPEGWLVEFEPDKIEQLAAFDEATVDVNIRPAERAIAGDYLVSFRAIGVQDATDEYKLRVTVETPTIWGTVGIVIIVVVVIALAVIFMRFSRR